MDNNFVFDTTKFVLDEVKKEALKTAMEEACRVVRRQNIPEKRKLCKFRFSGSG